MVASGAVVLRNSLFIFLLFCVRKPSFTKTNSICYSFRGEDAVDLKPTLIYESIYQSQQTRMSMYHRNIAIQLLLLLCGDVELCPGSAERRSIPELEELTKLKGMHCFIKMFVDFLEIRTT